MNQKILDLVSEWFSLLEYCNFYYTKDHTFKQRIDNYAKNYGRLSLADQGMVSELISKGLKNND